MPFCRKQALATKPEAEKDGAKVPTTLQEYCVVSARPRASESHMAMDDFYDDDYMDDEEEDEDDAIYEDEKARFSREGWLEKKALSSFLKVRYFPISKTQSQANLLFSLFRL